MTTLDDIGRAFEAAKVARRRSVEGRRLLGVQRHVPAGAATVRGGASMLSLRASQSSTPSTRRRARR